jgi:hypothetical protein
LHLNKKAVGVSSIDSKIQNYKRGARQTMTFRKYWIAAITAGMLTMGAVAQTSASSSASGNASVTPGQAGASASTSQSAQTSGVSTTADSAAALSSGTTLQAELTKSVDAKKAKSGDQVEAKLTQDVKSDGKVVLRKGSKLVGHVTEAQAKGKESAESKLGVVFDKAVAKDGQMVAFNGVIQALAPPVQGTLSASSDEASSLGSGMGTGGNSMGGGRSGGVVGNTTGAVSPAVGSTVGAVGGAAGSVTNSAAGAVNNTAGVAANGALNNTSHGIVGLQGLALNTATAGSAQGSVISSANHNVKLDSGTQMVLQVTGSAAAH